MILKRLRLLASQLGYLSLLQDSDASGLPKWLSCRKILPAVQETQEMWVRSLGQEDPLEEEMASHSNILAWKIPWTEEPGGLQFERSKESSTTVHALSL